jgi:hypothetical protein
MKLGKYIMAPQPISTTYLMIPSYQSVCLYVYTLVIARQRLGKNAAIVARQRLGKNVTVAMNTHATIELLDTSSSMRYVTYQGKYANNSSQNFLLLTFFPPM